MLCLTCKYPLGLKVPWRCPECGREFDPQRPETFRSDAVSKRRERVIGNATLGALVVVYVSGNLLAFQLEDVTAMRFPMNAHGFFSLAGPVVGPVLIGIVQALPRKLRPFDWYVALPAAATLLLAGLLSFNHVAGVFASC